MKPIILESIKDISKETRRYLGTDKTGRNYLLVPIRIFPSYIPEGKAGVYSLYTMELYKEMILVQYIQNLFGTKTIHKDIINILPYKEIEDDELMDIAMNSFNEEIINV